MENDIKNIIGKAVKKKEIKIRRWRIAIKTWWDKECSKKKKW